MNEKIKYWENKYVCSNGIMGVQKTKEWDQNGEYKDDEYIEVHFRMKSKGYEYPDFCFSAKDRELFECETAAVFEQLGWKCEERPYNGRCATWQNGKSHLYLHPNDFSGEVLKKEVKIVAEALQKGTVFFLQWVDVYDTVYDIPGETYKKYLQSREKEIRRLLFESCKTRRKTLFVRKSEVCQKIANRFRLKRMGEDDGRHFPESGLTFGYIREVLDQMIEEKIVVEVETESEELLVRSINKEEQKKLRKE